MKKSLKISVLAIAMPFLSWAQGFTTDNTNGNLLDACGNNFVMKGMSIPLAWYVSNVNGSIAALKTNTKSNCLRIVVTTSTADNDWQTCVKNCINNKIVPMVELHDVTGSTSAADLKRMGDFWASKASFLNSTNSGGVNIQKHILINLANEWGTWQTATDGSNGNTAWRDAVVAAIKPIRDAGVKTTIVIDAVGYGQDVKSASNIQKYAKAIQTADAGYLGTGAKANLLFSIHMYCQWANGGDSNPSIVSTIKNSGVPVIVGEFGYQHDNGNGGVCDIPEQTILNTCQTAGVGWLAWSQKGNGSPVQYLDLCTDWNCSQLSTAWGATIVNGTNGTKTAVECSVFSNTSCNSSCAPTTVTPSLQVSGGTSQSISSVSVNSGTSIKLSPLPATGGTWAWSGCGNSGTAREQTIMPTSGCTAVANFTNTCGTVSSLTFTISMIGAKACCGNNASNGYAYCCTNSDPDGDGWGWENAASCVVPSSAADPDKCKEVTTNIEVDNLSNQYITITPNPCKDVLSISNLPSNTIFTYRIYSTEGKLIAQENGVSSSNNTINTSLLKPDFYILKISDQSSDVVKKFVKVD
jgi:hypothetical protein